MVEKGRFSIRKYNSADLPVVLDLHQKALEAVGAYIDDDSIHTDLHSIEEHYFGNKGCFLVGTLDDSIVSMGAFRKLTDATAEIKRMRTYPTHQGNGFGTAILRELITRAKQLGYSELILETSDRQMRAQRLYARMGFERYKSEMIYGFNCTWFMLRI